MFSFNRSRLPVSFPASRLPVGNRNRLVTLEAPPLLAVNHYQENHYQKGLVTLESPETQAFPRYQDSLSKERPYLVMIRTHRGGENKKAGKSITWRTQP